MEGQSGKEVVRKGTGARRKILRASGEDNW